MWVHLYDYNTGDELDVNKGGLPSSVSSSSIVLPVSLHVPSLQLTGATGVVFQACIGLGNHNCLAVDAVVH